MDHDFNAGQENMTVRECMDVFLTPSVRARLDPYWIEPDALDVEKPTYQAFIQLERRPIESQNIEINGDLLEFSKKYPAAIQLAEEIHLDTECVEIERVNFSFWGLYEIRTKNTYNQLDIATAESHRLWAESLIAQGLEASTVVGVQFGVVDETGYRVYLGHCANAQTPWLFEGEQLTRDDHLAISALQETVALALDVEVFKAIFYPGIQDRVCLKLLHYLRSKSIYGSEQARNESREWLRSNYEEKNR